STMLGCSRCWPWQPRTRRSSASRTSTSACIGGRSSRLERQGGRRSRSLAATPLGGPWSGPRRLLSVPRLMPAFPVPREAVLRGELNTDRVQVSVTYPPVFGVTRTYASFSAIAQEVNDARVWGGIHFRRSDRHGYELGKRVGEAVLREFPGQTRAAMSPR